MAEYVRVDNLEVSDYVTVWDCNCSEYGKQTVMAVDDLQYLPTADVVPREEVDRLRHILNSYALQYGTVKDQQAAIDRIRQEHAREIFAVIDTLGTYNPTLYAELKKKYTEDGK